MDPSWKKIGEEIDRCMIADRFSLRKSLESVRSGRGGRTRVDALARAIAKSSKKVKKRRELVPKITFPETLPISDKVDEIRDILTKNQVVIIAGETGSGKTTQIPKICLSLGRGVTGMIGHTQPRRVAARTVAARIAEELGVNFGEQVGYQVRFTDQTSASSLIKVMTDGILLAETQNDQFLEAYDTIIIDEAHERTLNVDFLLGYLKRILPKRRDLKVIITSATIDVETFSQHFSGAPILQVCGRTYPVEVHYRPLNDADNAREVDELMYKAILDAVQEIVQGRGTGAKDILVFLSGEREIREVAQVLRKARLADLEVLPLYARLSVADQNRIFRPHRNRRVVLATNVAETSLTVPEIGYVIDPGFARISRYSFRSKVQRLPIERISRASAEQRKGRCGRVSKGACIRLYSEEDFTSRPEFTMPEILRTNLGSVILRMLSLRLGDIGHFPFIEAPDQRQINDGFHLLSEIQAVDKSREITRLGRDISRIPIDLRQARMLVQANKESSLSEVLIIVSALAIQDPRERPHDRQGNADRSHSRYWHEESDFMALLKLWNFYEEQRQALSQNRLRKLCKENFLSFIRMREWRDIHRQLHLMCRDMGYKENRTEADYMSIHKALLAGLLSNVGQKHDDNEYLGARNRKFFIFPGSSQFKRRPKWLVASELVETTRLYARTVARLDNEWIEPLAEHLVERSYSEPHWEKKRGEVVAFEQVTLYGLPIVSRRKVGFNKIDRSQSREIFIRCALVEGDVDTRAAFFEHNRSLISEVDLLESKTRKRDVMIDDHALYGFYHERIPDHVDDMRSFDAWRQEAEQDNAALLFLRLEDVMRKNVDVPIDAYPDSLHINGMNLNLRYQFDPEQSEDGVSLDVPVSILNQIPGERLDWMIPGYLREKSLALVRSLPKSIRKNFAPAADYVDRAIDGMEYDGRSLTAVLGERLRRISGVEIPASAWKEESIDRHLRMNIRVLDTDGKVLGVGRDLPALLQAHRDEARGSLRPSVPHVLERSGMTGWELDELPDQVEFEQAGVIVKAYPAMIDEGDSVAIALQDSFMKAQHLSKAGLLRLVMLALPQQVDYIRKNIPAFNNFSLYLAPASNQRDLRNEITEAVFRYVFVEDQKRPSCKAEFETLLQFRQFLVQKLNRLSDILANVLKLDHELRGRLQDLGSVYGESRTDLESQRHALLADGFLSKVPFVWLEQYPRYFQAAHQRLDKLRGGQVRDQHNLKELTRFTERIKDIDPEQLLMKHELQTFRWMVEEYRVSLFAQSLGTKVPVSGKRLEKQWAQAGHI